MAASLQPGLLGRTLVAILCISAIGEAYGAGAPAFAYVTNQESNSVSQIDLATLQVTQSFAVGRDPRGIAVTPDGRTLVTANQRDGDISLVDVQHPDVVRRIAIGKSPEFVRVSPDGRLALVTYEPSSKGGPPPDAGKGGAKEGAHEGREAAKAAEARSGADSDDDQPAEIAVVDLASLKVILRIPASKETEGMDFSPDGAELAVANEGDDSLLTFALPSLTLTRKVDISKLGSRPRGIKYSPDGSRIAVSLETSDRLLVLDRSLKLIKSLDTGKGPYGVTFTAKGDQLWNAAARSGLLQVWSGQDFTPVGSVAVGKRCWHFSFTPDQSQVLAACGRSDSVFVVDAQSLKPLQEIKGLHQPWGIVTFPKAMGTLDRP